MVENHDTGTQASGKKARILVVDDSKIVRVTATKILSAQFDLVLAEDGEEAWEKICADETIQVVFTDLGMPRLDGYGLIERIRQSDNEGIRNQPVIVITGAAEDEEVKRRVFELGATDFITKPFKSTEILARAEAHASYRRDKDSLQKVADVDLLTGTLNRVGLAKQLEKDIAFVNRHGENLALILFELDSARTVFERLGKEGAQRIVKQLGALLTNAVRKEDSVGRYGPEKFMLILPMAKTDGVLLLARRVCEKIKTFKITLGGEHLSLTLSAGIATAVKGHQVSAEGMVVLAEKALGNARKLGPGEVQLRKQESPQKSAEATVPASIDGLLDAIAKGEVLLTDKQQDALVIRLAPLIALMTDEHRRRLTLA